MSARRNAFASAAGLVAAATSAQAQEYCVVCTEPSALYRCILEDARPGIASSLQVVCISRIAKEGGHAKCAVKRGVTVFECDGVVKRISMAAAPTQPPAPVPAAPGAAPAPPAATPPPAAANHEPPNTVAEMAKRAKADNERNMEKAGTFLKNSLGCIASLFTKCSSGEQ